MAARVFIDIGDVHAADPAPTAVWDQSRWDDPAALWAGTMPAWVEISCRVRAVQIDRGRRGVLDIFEPGRATVTVANPDGWASWSPDSPGPLAVGAWLRIRADDQVLFTGSILRVLDAYTPAGELAAELVCVDPLARLGQLELAPRAPVGAGDTAAQRIGRVLDEARVAAELRDLDPGGPVLTATDLKGSMADQAQRAAATAGGHLYADRAGRIVYRDAGWLRTDPRATAVQAVISNEPYVPEPPAVGPPPAGSGVASSPSGSYGPNVPAHAVDGNVLTYWQAMGEIPRVTDPELVVTFPEPYRLERVTVQFYSVGFHFIDYTVQVGDGAGWATVATVTGNDQATVDHVFAPVVGDRFRLVATSFVPDGSYASAVKELTYTPAAALTPYADTVTAHLCATGIDANGPDMERLVNLVTCSGVDDADPEAGRVEVTQRDTASSSRYGPASFSVDQLYTRDPAQLTVLGSRVLELRSKPRVWIDSLTLSPVADPAASDFCATVDFGDRLTVAYRHPLGWGWSSDVHVHGIGYRLLPSGERNEVAEWTTTLTLDDATYWQPGDAWDYGAWDEAAWSAPARTTEAA